jgi:hypothetical protein
MFGTGGRLEGKAIRSGICTISALAVLATVASSCAASSPSVSADTGGTPITVPGPITGKSSQGNPCAAKDTLSLNRTGDGREIVAVATGSSARSSAVKTLPAMALIEYGRCIASSGVNSSSETMIVFDLTSQASQSDVAYLESAFRNLGFFKSVYETSGTQP